MNSTLHYHGKATRQNHGVDGVIYLHRWQTGFQYLIFPSKERAEEWLDGVKADEAMCADYDAQQAYHEIVNDLN